MASNPTVWGVRIGAHIADRPVEGDYVGKGAEFLGDRATVPFPSAAIAIHRRALSEENYLLAQTKNLHLATIDFSQFFRIGLSESTPLHEFRVFL